MVTFLLFLFPGIDKMTEKSPASAAHTEGPPMMVPLATSAGTANVQPGSGPLHDIDGPAPITVAATGTVPVGTERPPLAKTASLVS